MDKNELKETLFKLRTNKELNKHSLIYLMDLPKEEDLLDLQKNIDNNNIYIMSHLGH